MTAKEFITQAGRKFSWGYAALGSLTALAGVGRLTGGEFGGAFAALVAALMAANYGENREKARAAKEAKDAPPQAT